MNIIPRIIFKGNSREAIENYTEYFEANVDYVNTYGSAKIGSEEQKDLILNAQLDVKGNKLQFADHMNQDIANGNQITFNVLIESVDEVMLIYSKISRDGTILMKPTETFFSPCHCTVKDKFGITWQLTCMK